MVYRSLSFSYVVANRCSSPYSWDVLCIFQPFFLAWIQKAYLIAYLSSQFYCFEYKAQNNAMATVFCILMPSSGKNQNHIMYYVIVWFIAYAFFTVFTHSQSRICIRSHLLINEGAMSILFFQVPSDAIAAPWSVFWRVVWRAELLLPDPQSRKWLVPSCETFRHAQDINSVHPLNVWNGGNLCHFISIYGLTRYYWLYCIASCAAAAVNAKCWFEKLAKFQLFFDFFFFHPPCFSPSAHNEPWKISLLKKKHCSLA